MRAAGCFGVTDIFYSGNRYQRAAKFHTDTQQRSRSISLSHTEDLLTEKPYQARIVCIELVEGAIALPDYEHPENAYYVFGPEDSTVKQSMIDAADDVVYIPAHGCLNLSQTVNVVLYDRMAKNPDFPRGDELIRKVRDNNNHTQVNE